MQILRFYLKVIRQIREGTLNVQVGATWWIWCCSSTNSETLKTIVFEHAGEVIPWGQAMSRHPIAGMNFSYCSYAVSNCWKQNKEIFSFRLPELEIIQFETTGGNKKKSGFQGMPRTCQLWWDDLQDHNGCLTTTVVMMEKVSRRDTDVGQSHHSATIYCWSIHLVWTHLPDETLKTLNAIPMKDPRQTQLWQEAGSPKPSRSAGKFRHESIRKTSQVQHYKVRISPLRLIYFHEAICL